MATTSYKQVFQRAKARLGGRLAESKGEIALTALAKIVQRTPVLTGAARGNWNVSIGRPDTTRQRPAPTGAAPIERAKRVLGANRTGAGAVRKIFISNGLPYINRLENGWSQQAPAGMVGITLAELPTLATRIIQAEFGQR